MSSVGAVLGAPPFQHLRSNSVSDLPVERYERGVGRSRYLLPCGDNQGTQLANEHIDVGLVMPTGLASRGTGL